MQRNVLDIEMSEATTIKRRIIDYFRVLDESIDILSLHHEGEIVGLPSWVHTTRRILVGVTDDSKGIAIKIERDKDLDADEITVSNIKSKTDIDKILSPMSIGGSFANLSKSEFFSVSDISMVEKSNPLAIPVLDNRCLFGFGKIEGFLDTYDKNKSKQEAIDLWNRRNLPNSTEKVKYVLKVRNVLAALQNIIKRKAFLERRVHRFIDKYQKVLLPSFKNCFYEHVLLRNGEKRKADFILERENGLPAMLIELESPVHKVFTAKFDLTAPVNHARQQIAEWVSFIDMEPQSNAQNEFSFLSGPKERLIIIGRGLEQKAKLIETKFDGTVVWTYELFIEEARDRLNKNYASQCELLGMAPAMPF